MTETVQQALAKVMGSIGAVGKTDENSAQNYKFRGIDTVMAAVKPALVEHGVVFVPNVTQADAQELLIGKNQTRMRHVMLTVRFDIYGPAGDHIEATTVGEAMDSGDKSTNKALSAAFKYALMQVLCISDAGADDSDHDNPQLGDREEAAWSTKVVKGSIVHEIERCLSVSHQVAVELGAKAWRTLGDDSRDSWPPREAQGLIVACLDEADREHAADLALADAQ